MQNQVVYMYIRIYTFLECCSDVLLEDYIAVNSYTSCMFLILLRRIIHQISWNFPSLSIIKSYIVASISSVLRHDEFTSIILRLT